MSLARNVTLLVALSTPVAAAPTATHVGTVTDSMCNTDHQAMKVSPDSKCVRDCVGDTSTFKYALSVGTRTYLLSDQETPATFAGRKVRVTGILYRKTNILKVERIDPVN